MKKMVWMGLVMAAVGVAQAGVIFHDDFTTDDGSWLGDGDLTVSGGAASSSADGDQSFLKYFTPQTLAVGDSIELTWEAKVTSWGATQNLGRLGLINSKGTKITGDTAYEDAALSNDTGYGFFVNDLRDNSSPWASYVFAKRTVANKVLVATSSFGMILATVSDTYSTMGTGTWTPTQTIRMTRTATGWDLYTVMGGVEGKETFPAMTQTATSIVDASPETTFDGVFFWFNSGAPSGDVSSIRNVTLTVTSK